MGIENDIFTSLYQEHVDKVASRMARKYPHTTADDVAQELWVYLLEEGHDYLQRRMEKALAAPDDEYVMVPPVGALLSRKADRFLSSEAEDYEHFQGNFMYSPNDVKYILSEGLDRQGDVDGRVDVTEALNSLAKINPSRHKAIVLRYAPGMVDKPNKDALSRGIVDLCDLLNKRSRRERISMAALELELVPGESGS